MQHDVLCGRCRIRALHTVHLERGDVFRFHVQLGGHAVVAVVRMDICLLLRSALQHHDWVERTPNPVSGYAFLWMCV